MQKSIGRADFLGRHAAKEEEDEDSIDLLVLARTLWVGKWWVLLAALVGLAIGIWQAFFFAVPSYRSTAEMALLGQESQILDVQQVLSGLSHDESSMNTEMAIIRSRDLVGRLVDQMDLVEDPEFNSYLPDPVTDRGLRASLGQFKALLHLGPEVEEPTPEDMRRVTIDETMDAITTSIDRDSYVFRISARSRDEEKSIAMANAMAEIYYNDQIRQKTEATEQAAEWLSSRVGELRVELQERQTKLGKLQSDNALVSPEILQSMTEQAVELRTQSQAAQSRVRQIREQLAAMEGAEGPREIARAAEDAQLIGIAASVANGEAGAQERFDRRLAQVRLRLEAELSRAQDQIDELQTTARDLQDQFEEQSTKLQGLQQFQRETEATQVLYDTFLARLKETTVQQGVHQADSRILSEATKGELVAPKKLRTLILMLLLGLMAGSGGVLLREYMQNTFRTADELERVTGQTVLGQIPTVPARERKDAIAYLRKKPTSAAAEAVRDLRTSILLSDLDNPPQVIMSCSSIPGEGKTTLSLALAQNLAGLDKKVLLIEGDIRRRTLNAYFTVEEGQGSVLSVLSGKMTLAEAARPAQEMPIDVLMGEPSSVNAADVFSSEPFRRLIAAAREAYDYVIIDSPPVLVVPDARVIAQHVDALLYSVKWDSTMRSQVVEGLKQFRSVNIDVAGLVLSQIDAKGMQRYGHGGKYGAYGRYGQEYYEA